METIETQNEKATVRFFDGLEIDGYRLPSGEYGVSLEGASAIVGYHPDWLRQAFQKETRMRETLEAMGFRAFSIHESVSREETLAGSTPKTISIEDFACVITYASSQGKKAAIALQSALFNMSLRKMFLQDFFRDAFGERPPNIEVKRQLLYKTYAATISPEHWKEMEPEEILTLSGTQRLRPFGLCAGEFTVPEDFDAPLPEEILCAFEGQ